MNSTKKFLSIALLLSCPIVCAADTKKNSTPTTKSVVREKEDEKEEQKERAEPLVERYINSVELMQTSEDGKAFQQQMAKTNEELTNKVKKEQDQITAAIAEFEDKKSTLTPIAAKAEESKLEEKKRNFANNYETYKNELQLKGQEIGEKLTEKIKDATEQVSKENGIDVVKDIVTGQLVYASEKALITQEVVQAMNAKSGKSSSKSKE